MFLYLIYFEQGGCHRLVKEKQVCIRNISAARLKTIARTQRRASYTEWRQREEERFSGKEEGRREGKRGGRKQQGGRGEEGRTLP